MTEQERIMYQELAQEFWVQIEKEAAELGHIDYYLESSTVRDKSNKGIIS